MNQKKKKEDAAAYLSEVEVLKIENARLKVQVAKLQSMMAVQQAESNMFRLAKEIGQEHDLDLTKFEIEPSTGKLTPLGYPASETARVA